MTEAAKRLQPTGDTLRELYLRSGNFCAFPGCTNLIMDINGVFIGQLCHIEGAVEGGERFNSAMTNEQRRSAPNLMLMCYPHHKVTDDVGKFPVARLREFKEEHEARFSNPDRAILAKIKDWTTSTEPIVAKNLRRMARALGWNPDDADLLVSARVLADYIDKLRVVPIEVRSFLGKVAVRAHRAEGTSAVARGRNGFVISCNDVRTAFGVDHAFMREQIDHLATYGLASLDEITIGERQVPALLVPEVDGWPLWKDLAKFCANEASPMEAFTEQLDFSRLDE